MKKKEKKMQRSDASQGPETSDELYLCYCFLHKEASETEGSMGMRETGEEGRKEGNQTKKELWRRKKTIFVYERERESDSLSLSL